MKLLHKLLGVSNYIEQLENKLFDKNQYYSNRLTEQKEVNNILNKERNELLATKSRLLVTKSRLTAETFKLTEQLQEATKKVEVLEQLNLEYLTTNEELMLKIKKLEDANFNIKHTVKHRLIGFLRDDLGIVLKPQDINYYDD